MEGRTIKSLYIFECNIDIVFDYIKDFTKTDNLFKLLRSNTEITKGCNTYTVGSNFFYTVSGSKIEFQTEEMQDEDSFKSIKWRVQTSELNYTYLYNIYYCIISNETVLEWILELSELKSDFNKEAMIQDQNEIMKQIKEFIIQDKAFFTVSSSMIIRTDRLSVLKHVLSLDNLKNSPLYFGKIKYSGDSSKPGSKIIFQMPLLGIEYKMTVNKIDVNEKNKRWIYSLKLSSEDGNKLPFYVKELIFCIYMIHNKKILLEVKHKISSEMPNDKAVLLKQQQNELLKEIFNLESSKEKDEDDNE